MKSSEEIAQERQAQQQAMQQQQVLQSLGPNAVKGVMDNMGAMQEQEEIPSEEG